MAMYGERKYETIRLMTQFKVLKGLVINPGCRPCNGLSTVHVGIVQQTH